MANVQCKKLKKMSPFRKIAIGTWRTAYDPSIYGTMRLRMDRSMDYIERFRKKTGLKLTPTHLVTKAVALALQACPEANAILRWNRIYVRDTIDISLLVVMEADGKMDLSAVKLERVDELSLPEMVTQLEAHVARVRARKDKALEKTRKSMLRIPFFFINFFMKMLSFFAYTLNWNMAGFGVPKDAFGGSIVTSIGSIGLDIGYVPIVPYSRVPLYAAPGAVHQEPLVDEDGQVTVGKIMNLNATFDHRVVDGAHAAVLAKTIRAAFEDPEKAFGAIDQMPEAKTDAPAAIEAPADKESQSAKAKTDEPSEDTQGD